MNTEATAARAIAREALLRRERDEMFELLAHHFDGVSRDQFENDLAEKNWVILLSRGVRLVGFSTLLAYETTVDREPVSVIYSGDTIVAPEAWGSSTLARAWIDTVHQLRQFYPRGGYYWLLLTSGYRTYRFLPVFWKSFWPHFANPTPHDQEILLRSLALGRFGERFHPDLGIVRFQNPQRLRRDLAFVPAGRIVDPHIRFFLERNPGHGRGDELVCLADLSESNLTSAGRRMLLPRHHERAPAFR